MRKVLFVAALFLLLSATAFAETNTSYETKQIMNMTLDFASQAQKVTGEITVVGGQDAPFTERQHKNTIAASGVDSGTALAFTKAADFYLLFNYGPASIYYEFDTVASSITAKLSPGSGIGYAYPVTTIHVMGISGTAEVRCTRLNY